MRLSSLFLPPSQTVTENSMSSSELSFKEQELMNGLKEILSRASGSVILGDVVESNGSDVILSIGKNQLLQAKLDNGANVEPGMQLSFEIKNTTGNKVILTPLYSNAAANDPNIAKALKMAGLPENPVTTQMVQTMMKEGMSVSRDALLEMMRNVNLHPEADMETLVQLKRLNLPITDNTIEQMDAYKNFQHQMSEGIMEIADSLEETFLSLPEGEQAEQGEAIYRSLLDVLSQPETDMEAEGKENILREELPDNEQQEVTQQTENVKTEDAKAEEGLSTARQTDYVRLAGHLEKLDVPAQITDSIAEGNLPDKEILKLVNQALNRKDLKPEQKEETLKLLKDSGFQKLVRNEMSRQWLLKPEDVAEKEKVDKYYEKLNSHMNKLTESLEQAGKMDTSFGKAVTNLNGNMDFMNQLNHMFTYIQLPLALKNQEANGELYVYTNKKNLAKKDGEVSAFLHLDLEHLGSVDVHVKLKDTNVSTKFYLQDDSSLDLIAEHIDILNERLNKRGYSMEASFVQKSGEEKTSVMEEILATDKNISLLSTYSFDARA